MRKTIVSNYNLNNMRGREEFRKNATKLKYSIQHWLSGQHCGLNTNGHVVMGVTDRGFVVNDNGIITAECIGDVSELLSCKMDTVKSRQDRNPPSAVVLGDGVQLLLNGDDDEERPLIRLVNGFTGAEKYPTISFRCLALLLKVKKPLDAARQVANGNIKLVDWAPDSLLPLNKKEKAQLKEAAKTGKVVKIKPHAPGYTIVNNNCWHRPATTLFHNVKNNQYYLIGMDEGTYFGVELPKRAKTVGEAIDILQPTEAKVTGVLRQGEWFIVPVAESKLPKLTNSLTYSLSVSNLALPIQDKDSNLHTICADKFMLSKDGSFYAKDGELTHPEHDSVAWGGWVTFVCNTAVRSVSVQGVD